MEHAADIGEKIESRFLSLLPEEKTAVISHGVAICFSDLNKRLFLALGKIRFFEDWKKRACRTMRIMKCMKTASCGITGKTLLRKRQKR
ncbi:MAG: hypothetical protein B6245_23925 [Desulfobacteraceae bacterium 4572_88]|nr:MAG: hypothetical protein B6245_23925 [Desulfobacteraceae bacterium 4572_88]